MTSLDRIRVAFHEALGRLPGTSRLISVIYNSRTEKYVAVWERNGKRWSVSLKMSDEFLADATDEQLTVGMLEFIKP